MMRRLLPLALLTYSVAVWLGVEVFNNLPVFNGLSGGESYLQQWYAQYYVNGEPSGSLKWRSTDGALFQDFALLFGTWVYPFCVLGAVLYAKMAVWARARASRIGAVLGALVCLAILGRFLYLGVFTAVASG